MPDRRSCHPWSGTLATRSCLARDPATRPTPPGWLDGSHRAGRSSGIHPVCHRRPGAVGRWRWRCWSIAEASTLIIRCPPGAEPWWLPRLRERGGIQRNSLADPKAGGSTAGESRWRGSTRARSGGSAACEPEQQEPRDPDEQNHPDDARAARRIGSCRAGIARCRRRLIAEGRQPRRRGRITCRLLVPLLIGRIDLRLLEVSRPVGSRQRTQHRPKGRRAKSSGIVRLRVIARRPARVVTAATPHHVRAPSAFDRRTTRLLGSAILLQRLR